MQTKIPAAVAAAFEGASKNNARGTICWVKTLSEKRGAEFDATIRAYLVGRADGTIGISLKVFTQVLRTEFKYPFADGALRGYMDKHYAKLFAAQSLER